MTRSTTRSRTALLTGGFTALALLAFAGNSLLCRAALAGAEIDAASFTAIRLGSGAAMLWILVNTTHRGRGRSGSWMSALALFAYAAAFSLAYLSLPTGTGALLLFGAVQATMILWGIARGERLGSIQILGLLLAIGGLVYLVSPGLAAPPLRGSLLMLGAGVAWGIYSLRGRGDGDPLRVTTGNFVRAAPLALAWVAWLAASRSRLEVDAAGAAYAAASGAITSGVGYALWYAALPGLSRATAATVQLSVPLIAAAGGIALLGERATMRLALAAAAVLGGIAMVVWGRRGRRR